MCSLPELGRRLLGPLLLLVACPGGEQARPRAPTPGGASNLPDAQRKKSPAQDTPRHARDPQPLFRGDPARTGRAAGLVPRAAPRIRWRFETGRPIAASPVVDAALIAYVGSLDGSLYALDPRGRLLWRRPFGDRVFASAALVPAGLVVGADDDRVRWLDRSGAVRWSLPLGACSPVRRGEGRGPERVRCDADSSPVVAPDGTILLGGDALHALTADGRLRFRLELGGHVRSSPALGPDGTIYVGVQGGAIVAVSGDGKKRWERRELYDFDSTPAVADGLVAVGCDDGRLYGLDAASGAVRFRVPTRGPIRSSPAIAPGGTILFGSDDGALHAVDASGAPRFRFATGGPIRSSPAVDATGATVFGSQDDSLYALSADGALLWRVELGGDVDSSPAVLPDGTILCGADDGVLYALGR